MTAFVTDTFTGTNGTAITSHTSDSGHTLSRYTVASTNTATPQILSNQLAGGETSGTYACYLYSATPASADYSASIDVLFAGGTIERNGPVVRASSSDGYYARLYTSSSTAAILQVGSIAVGALNDIPFTCVSGTTYRITIDVSGTTIKARCQRLSDSYWLNSSGSFVSGQVDTVSFINSLITAAGSTGWRFLQYTGGSTLDNFSADQAGAPDTTVPTQTGSITVTNKTSTSYTLTWPAGADNVAVAGYEYLLDGGTTYTDAGNVLTVNVTGRTPGATDSVKVRDYDAAGNRSTPPLTLSVTLDAATGSFVTEPIINNTGTVRASQAAVWSWYPGGRIGAMAAITPVDGTGTTDGSGVLTVSGLALGAGVLQVAVQVTDATDDDVYYEAGTVA